MNYIARMGRHAITRLLPRSAREVRCSGCGESCNANNPMISGPGVYLCRGCFRTIAASIAPRRPPADGVRCHFCRQFRAPAEVGRSGDANVCADCLGTMGLIFDGRG